MAVVVITGASSGLGAAMARIFAERGHDVGLIARREQALTEVAEAARALGVRAATAPADVTDREGMNAAVARLVDDLGPVDILVANAGTSALTAATRWDAENIKWIMRVNYEGVVNSIDTVINDMIKRQSGQVVVVSSPASLVPLPNQSAYSASKVAVDRLIETMAMELWDQGVRFTICRPGFTKTELTGEGGLPMPMMMEADYAAGRMVDAILKGRSSVNFPFALITVAKVGNAVPRVLYRALMKRVNPVPKPK